LAVLCCAYHRPEVPLGTLAERFGIERWEDIVDAVREW
jgi:hypothetical protein